MSDFICFATRDGIVFEFRIAGFAYPNDSAHEYDTNWLIIEGAIQHPSGNWTFRDTCLLMPEVTFLADWFEAVENGTEKKSFFIAMEPELSFSLINDNSVRTLRAILSRYARAPWSQVEDEQFIDFPVEELNLKLASALLRSQVKEHNTDQRIEEDMKPFDEWLSFPIE